MGAGIAALRRVAEGEQEAFVATGQSLETKVARHRELHRLARQVADLAGVGAIGLDQPFMGEQIGDTWARLVGALARRRWRHDAAGQRRIEQAMGIVEGGTEQLAAREVLEGGRDTALDAHPAGFERLRVAEARQRGAIGAHEEDGFDQVATRLHDGKGGELAIVERALSHGSIDGEAELLDDLVEAQGGNIAIAAPPVGEQGVSVGDGGFATLDGHIHQCASSEIRVVRGRPMTSPPPSNSRSMPRGNRSRFWPQSPRKSSGRPCGAMCR